MGPTDLNLKQAARFLGVHYMTAYRYVRLGKLPAHQEGTAWVVRRADIDAFVKAEATPTSLPSDLVSAMHRALELGDEAVAWRVTTQALASGHDFTAVHLVVLQGALARIRDDVDAGRRSPVHERIAIGTAVRIAHRLGGRVSHRGRKLGTVVLATPPGERHVTSLAFVTNLIRNAGYAVIDLGAEASSDELGEAIALVSDPAAVALSITTVAHIDATARTIAQVRARYPDLPVLVGGQAVRSSEVAALIGAQVWSTGEDLLDALRAHTEARRAQRARRRVAAPQNSSSNATSPVTPT